LILVHYKDGMTRKLDPLSEVELCLLDPIEEQRRISRVAIIDSNGHRVDLPLVKDSSTRIWIELVMSGEIPRGERVCMRLEGRILRVTLYYSDGRIVVDF